MDATHTMPFVAHNTRFYRKAGATSNEYNPIFLKGINIGQTLPDTSLANPNLSYDVYMEWLDLIREMNVNTVKVFTLMDAYFYQALTDHNRAHPEATLYLMQGIWINGGDTSTLGHAFEDEGELSAAYKENVKKNRRCSARRLQLCRRCCVLLYGRRFGICSGVHHWFRVGPCFCTGNQ